MKPHLKKDFASFGGGLKQQSNRGYLVDWGQGVCKAPGFFKSNVKQKEMNKRK